MAIEKKSVPGCLVDEATFRAMCDAMVQRDFCATFQVGGPDIHNNGPLVEMREKLDPDNKFEQDAGTIKYDGEPLKVKGYITINAPDGGASNYWSRPKLRVSRGGTVIAILDDLVMQQNGAYDGDATINGVFFDLMPGANPAYLFEWFDKENRTATLPPEDFSQIALEASEMVKVFP